MWKITTWSLLSIVCLMGGIGSFAGAVFEWWYIEFLLIMIPAFSVIGAVTAYVGFAKKKNDIPARLMFALHLLILATIALICYQIGS